MFPFIESSLVNLSHVFPPRGVLHSRWNVLIYKLTQMLFVFVLLALSNNMNGAAVYSLPGVGQLVSWFSGRCVAAIVATSCWRAIVHGLLIRPASFRLAVVLRSAGLACV